MAKNIQRDLAIGLQAEKRLVSLLETHKYVCEIKNKYEYDILATKNFRKTTTKEAYTFEATFEVKNDIMAAKTGNIAIEFYNTRSCKDSGIAGTRADFWVHITDKIYIISVTKLRELLKTTKPKRIISSGGDNNASLYLYPIEFMTSNFECLETMSTTKVNQFLKENKSGTSESN